MVFLKKLVKAHIWRRIFMERLTEPLHLNVLSGFVALFGSYRAKIAFDLIVRQHNAFCILKAADIAKERGIGEVYLLEFGVAAGAGLMNMAEIAARVTACTGVQFRLAGFDTGEGMPPAVDYRDHPEHYQEGDFQMDFEALRTRLPKNTELILGNIRDTVPAFLARLDPACPIGYVVLDVDYYSSSKDALAIFGGGGALPAAGSGLSRRRDVSRPQFVVRRAAGGAGVQRCA